MRTEVVIYCLKDQKEGDESRMINFATREAVVQNLKDAGCSIDMIENFMKSYDSENLSEQMLLLEKHRKQLLSRVHKEEKHITCLDYLVYELKKINSL